jgi:hypothetical protein
MRASSAPSPAFESLYFCQRSRVHRLRRPRHVFQMTIGADEWSASRKASFFALRASPCAPPDAFLLFGNGLRDFSLRLMEPFGEEVMAMRFTAEGAPRLRFRRLAVSLFAGGAVRRLASARPRRGALGQWALDLGPRFAVPSRKNARLDGDGGPIFIRKCRPGGLEVQTADAAVAPVCLFALCIASFAARKA